MLPEVLTVDDMMQLLDCTADTVEARNRARELPGLKFGRAWIYPRDAVLDVLRIQALAHVRTPAPASSPAGSRESQKIVPIAPRPPACGSRRSRGRTPAPLPDPPS